MLKHAMLLPDGPAQQARDSKFKSFNSWHYDGPWNGKHIDDLPCDVKAPNYMAWQNGHDATLFVSMPDRRPSHLLTSSRPSVDWTSSWA